MSTSPAAALAALLALGCGTGKPQPGPRDATVDAATGPCLGSYGPPEDTSVGEPALRETSGVVALRHNPDVLWLHNDSGDRGRLFALATDGTPLGQLAVPGLDHATLDLEDIAAATCPDGSGPCLWLADTGNNLLDRTDLAVYAVAEPAVTKARPLGQATASRVWRLGVTYDRPAIDSEALVVAADGRAFHLFEKVDGKTARVFAATGPFVDGAALTMTTAGTLTSPGLSVRLGRMITGADLHPDGDRLLLRVYTGSYEYRGLAAGWASTLDAATRVTVALGPLTEPQGEAIAYDHAGRGVWTVSEDPKLATAQPLHYYPCQ